MTLTGESPTRYAARHRLRGDVELDEERHEDGREDRPLRNEAGHDEVQHHDDQDHPDQQRQGSDARLLEPVREADRDDVGDVAVVEERDELADHQQHEDQPGQPRERLRDGRDDIGAAAERLRAISVGDAADQEHRRDDEDEAVHERGVADDVPGRGSRSGAPPGRVSRSSSTRLAIAASPAKRRPRNSFAFASGSGAAASPSSVTPVHREVSNVPSRGSTMRVVTIRGHGREDEARDDREEEVGDDRDGLATGELDRLVP